MCKVLWKFAYLSVSNHPDTDSRVWCSEVMTVNAESGQDTQEPANSRGSASLPKLITGFKHNPERVKNQTYLALTAGNHSSK